MLAELLHGLPIRSWETELHRLLWNEQTFRRDTERGMLAASCSPSIERQTALHCPPDLLLAAFTSCQKDAPCILRVSALCLVTYCLGFRAKRPPARPNHADQTTAGQTKCKCGLRASCNSVTGGTAKARKLKFKATAWRASSRNVRPRQPPSFVFMHSIASPVWLQRTSRSRYSVQAGCAKGTMFHPSSMFRIVAFVAYR